MQEISELGNQIHKTKQRFSELLFSGLITPKVPPYDDITDDIVCTL